MTDRQGELTVGVPVEQEGVLQLELQVLVDRLHQVLCAQTVHDGEAVARQSRPRGGEHHHHHHLCDELRARNAVFAYLLVNQCSFKKRIPKLLLISSTLVEWRHSRHQCTWCFTTERLARFQGGQLMPFFETS